VKRTLSLILVIALLIMQTCNLQLSAITVSDVESQLGVLISNTYKPGNSPPTSSYRSGMSGCAGFADLLTRLIYQHNLTSQASAMQLNTNSNIYQIGNTLSHASGNLNTTSLKNLLLQSQSGDIVQMDYTTYDGEDSRHTMMVYSVSSTGIVFYHAGSSKVYYGASTGSEPLWGTTGKTLTWDALIYCLRNSDDGISLYRSTTVTSNIHQHNWVLQYYRSAHPHYSFYRCSSCGAEYNDTNSSNFSSACDTCTKPGSSTISTDSLSVYTNQKVKFTWTPTNNTTSYCLKYRDPSYSYITVATTTATTYEFVFTEPGNYCVYVDSLNEKGQYTQSNLLYINVTHGHLFEETGYETAHPHENYKKCGCGYKEYLGNCTKVSTCDDCISFSLTKGAWYNNHKYEVYTIATTWSKAKAFCEAKGGHLVTVNDNNELAFLNTVISGNVCWTLQYFDIVRRSIYFYYGVNPSTISTANMFICEYDPYTISFDSNGGDDILEPITKAYGTTAYIHNYGPTREGYKFIGWSTDPNATAGTYWYGSEYTGNADITLYAVWTSESFDEKYDYDNDLYYYSYKVDGVNIERGVAKFILYDENYGSNTMTNEYGCEATIDATGKVISNVYGVGSAKIPSGGFVLSAHSSQDNRFVIDYVKVGDYVYFDSSNETAYVFPTLEKMQAFLSCRYGHCGEEIIKNKVDATYDSCGYTGDICCSICNELIYYGEYTDMLIGTGDANGDGNVDASDLIVLKKALLGVTDIDESDSIVCDINGDGEINILDLIRLKKILVSITNTAEEQTVETQTVELLSETAYLDNKSIVISRSVGVSVLSPIIKTSMRSGATVSSSIGFSSITSGVEASASE